MKIKELVKDLEIVEFTEKDKGDLEIAVLETDSRKIQINGLFFCLIGENADGHNYAQEAVKNGAIALVVERHLTVDTPQIIVKDVREALGLLSACFYGQPAEQLKIVGITGTNGKTTTAHMLSSILKKANKKVGLIGTLGAWYAEKKITTSLTTPDPIALHAIFADMVRHGIKYVVMEVSAHALYYKKTLGITFCCCIFTNFSQDHLDFFHTMQGYKQAKMGLFTSPSCSVAVLNGDEETGREIGALIDKENGACKTTYYGLHTPTDAFAVITDESLYGLECVFNINDKLSRITLCMTGRHNVYNALAAASCATELGIDTASIALGLSALKGVEGRLQRVGGWKHAEIYVDFAHTPEGLGKSLDALRPHCKGRLICLYGCGGNRDKLKRPLMGEIAAKKADFCILTSDNPRYEDPLDIIVAIERGYRRFSVQYVVVPERKKALEYAFEFLKAGDILLVAGKGGENYQEIMGIKYPFNDKDIIEKILEQKGKDLYS